MGKPSDHGVTWSPFAAAAPAPLVGLDHLAGQYGTIRLESLPGDNEAEFVEAAEGSQVGAGERISAPADGSVVHVEVFRAECVGALILGRPRPLSGHRRAGPPRDVRYTLIWEEPINPDMAPFKQIAATVAQNESGFNPNVMNNWDSNAAAGTPSGGLMQFIQPTFEAYKWPGFDNWMGAVDQILAWWKYVNARYGGPFNIPGIASLAGGGGYVGYASGTTSAASGLAWVGEQGPELVDFAGGERVINGQQMGGLEDAIAQRVIGLLQQLRVALIVDGHQMGQVIDGRISMAGAAAHGSRW
ncbi:Hypothetical protein PFR_JS17-2_2036 [Propionibacterium freudenreichii]|nr:Hypothetical protein PFR_JS17-1_2037 [Propionibacterium freudenreichii]SCQ81251.1 Hypothetical protein PFR_JS17-2_2036 [Propionibacterium freudenreichii]